MTNKGPGNTKKKFVIYIASFFQRLGILLIIAFSLLASVKLFSGAVDFRGVEIKNDTISRNENRFTELRKVLRGEIIVGYVSDIIADWGVQQEEYYLTQYALSPTLVDTEKRSGFIVGNFHTGHLADNANTEKLFLIKNFGNGVMLFKDTGGPK